jgi:hypothetical protein
MRRFMTDLKFTADQDWLRAILPCSHCNFLLVIGTLNNQGYMSPQLGTLGIKDIDCPQFDGSVQC